MRARVGGALILIIIVVVGVAFRLYLERDDVDSRLGTTTGPLDDHEMITDPGIGERSDERSPSVGPRVGKVDFPSFRLFAATEAGKPVRIVDVRKTVPTAVPESIVPLADPNDASFLVPESYIGAEMTIACDGFLTVSVRAAPKDGIQRLTLVEKHAIFGEVRVFGRPIDRRLLVLAYDVDDEGTADGDGAKAGAPADRTPKIPNGRPIATATTEREGTFALFGFDSGRRIALAFSDGEEFLECDRPGRRGYLTETTVSERGLVLDLLMRPKVRARLRAADGRTLVGAFATVYDAPTESSLEVVRGLTLDASQTTTFRIRGLPSARLIQFESGEYIGLAPITAGFSPSIDLGEVAMAKRRAVKVTVLSSEGLPIIDAKIAWASHRSGPAAETDGDGRAEIRTIPGVGRLEVKAFGFLPTAVDVGDENEMTVRLLPGPILYLEFVADRVDGRLPRLLVRLTCETTRLESEKSKFRPMATRSRSYARTERGERSLIESFVESQIMPSREDDGSYEFDLGFDRRLAIDELSADHPVKVEILCAYSKKVLQSETIRLDSERPTEAKINVIVPDRSFYGQIVDGDGRPIEGASITTAFGKLAIDFLATTTDSEGRFRIGPIVPDRVTIAVKVSDLVPATFEVMPNDGEPVRVLVVKN